MSRDWFVFHKDHHQGPFLKKELIDMLHQGNLSMESLVWKIGTDGWKPFKEYSELGPVEFDSDGPPPFIPASEKTKNRDGTGLIIPSPFEKKELDSYQSRIAQIEEESHGNLLDKHKIETLNPKIKMIIGVITVFLLISTVVTLFILSKESIALPEINQLDRNRLEDIIDEGTFDKVKMEFALSLEGDEIVAATNRSNDADLYLTLNSLYGKILSEEQIDITTEGRLRNNYAKFSVLKFDSGSKLIPGYYMAKVYGKSSRLIDKFYSFIREIPLVKEKNIFGESSSNFAYRGVILLTNSNVAKFKKSLELFNQNLLDKKTKLVKNMIESYSTLNSILEKLDFLYSELMGKIKKGEEIKEMELIYFNELGPVLEGIILQNYDSNVLAMKNGQLNAFEHKALLEYGKQIGTLSSELLSETKGKKKITVSLREELLNKYKSQIEFLLKKGKSGLLKYEEQLKQEENRFKSFRNN